MNVRHRKSDHFPLGHRQGPLQELSAKRFALNPSNADRNGLEQPWICPKRQLDDCADFEAANGCVQLDIINAFLAAHGLDVFNLDVAWHGRVRSRLLKKVFEIFEEAQRGQDL
jgi:hypothetical protein